MAKAQKMADDAVECVDLSSDDENADTGNHCKFFPYKKCCTGHSRLNQYSPTLTPPKHKTRF